MALILYENNEHDVCNLIFFAINLLYHWLFFIILDNSRMVLRSSTRNVTRSFFTPNIVLSLNRVPVQWTSFYPGTYLL